MSQKKLKIAFMGTPDFSVPALRNLIANPRYDVVAIYSQPPRPKGRGQSVQLSPIHQVGQAHNIPVYTPKNFKHEKDLSDFKALNLDVAIVAAYGLILPEEILNAPQYGCINIHASLLPRWRGAAPIQRAILAGDDKTGITIMQMDKGLDTGPEILKKEISIRGFSTATSIHDELSALGSAMIEDVLDRLLEGKMLSLSLQEEDGVTYAHMLKKEDGRIDWTQSAAQIDRQIRALNPWPGTWCQTAAGKRLKILEATLSDEQEEGGNAGKILNMQGHISCGEKSALQLIKIQPENKKPMDFSAALNGGYLKIGDILS